MKFALAALLNAAVFLGHVAALRVHGPHTSISKTPEDDGTPKNSDYFKELLGTNNAAQDEMNQLAVMEGDDGKPKNPDYYKELGTRQPWLYNADVETAESIKLSQGTKVGFQVVGNKALFFGPSGWRGYYDMYQVSSDPATHFVVYRRNGPGPVVVGDVIALYTKDHGKWFSMLGCNPQLSTCPGSPSNEYGMSTDELWFKCNGEAFKIYARNKNLGDVIVAQDHVQLYYLGGGNTLNVWGTPECAGSATTRPPPSDSYTYLNTLELWIA